MREPDGEKGRRTENGNKFRNWKEADPALLKMQVEKKLENQKKALDRQPNP